MNKKNLARWLVVPIALLLIIVLLMQISLSDIVNAFLSISPQFLALSFILYVLLYVFRAIRFRLMLKSRAGYGTLFNIVCLHMLANSILPFKTGELAFVYLSKARMDLQAGIGLATVAIARMFDALAVCVLFVLALVMTRGKTDIFTEAEPLVLTMAVLLIVGIVLAIWYGRQLLDVINRLLGIKVFGWLPLPLIRSKLEEVVDYYSSPDSQSKVLIIFGLSLLIWIMASLSMSILAVNMGLGIGIWAIIAATMVSVMFSALPIHGIASLGTTELILSAAFMALGAPKDAAISSAFAIHLMVLMFTALLSIYAIVSDHVFQILDKKSFKSG
ncbi:lysylphosphatidylglycerol synthase transmembrane domain-containing protein [Methanocella conradii]|uniref:lysylphosphatidylglycerol synthase transmembrane domain-containing protein n=1 Tax=Methanocella conradii TaxID=1175444 RepID=UPI00157D9489|nr:lysylphosphatidylglycerol synthase transmembrane domain-containing protein [Methanocella conradii]